ncbi:EAL domain-containing protein [Arthrobacter bambusae]|uniref:EAL domain-containing protein (Putative c-di-GMP-specific phosphodiesterase class I) n=1 Tax=Arthrobacter bambusae TaxID=1338426 RepID=A0AAW8DCP8_9MICC|nr:EAL domain-containing protein [Arthrobacter bambusae]MDP9903627.1 EAL domain-containing protein (putative c-di-GMP-specific phosphodiesterase class I) [Arthrobacter bambusae]MDQ0128379.1 EAL domain-containing protein (putative c-di-GMP-specific phosphodiesterase class I) [Arthrobacter bambusae]MDQ0179720.1 EAL domain-containing protein (putative c-di-GMP-specific phosphodiesterase class I) [Arthrobacter bambusae]
MSTRKPSARALTDSGMPASPEATEPPLKQLRGLRLQVLEIIDEVLGDSSQATDAVREELRRHIAAHPGRPEEALLEHLSSLRSEQPAPQNEPESQDNPAAQGEPESQHANSQHAISQHPSSARLEAVLRDHMLMTAFQPVFDLTTSTVVGAEALTRFVSDSGDPADYWFAEAEDSGLRTDLEFAALESGLEAALKLPPHLFVALKLSDEVCLDPRLPGLFEQTPVAPARVILEVSGKFPQEQAASLDAAAAPLRSAGVRLSIENTGSFFAGASHILRLKPEMIKLERNLTAGLNQDSLRQELVEAEVAFALEIGAALIAQRIETKDELATLADLGVTLGEGYHLGRPSVQPSEWAKWGGRSRHLASPGGRGRTTRS